MKTRYTFQNYIVRIAFLGTVGVVGISWLIASVLYLNYFPLSIFIGLFYLYPALIIGFFASLISGMSVGFLTFIFFRTPNPYNPIFQIMSISLVSIITFFLSHIVWNMTSLLFNVENFALLHAIPTTLALTFVHYRALPYMFGTVQKRKEK